MLSYSIGLIMNNALILIISLFSFLFSEKIVNDDDFSNHMELFIHEDIINEFLLSFGKIKGHGSIGLFNYDWNVSNLRVNISPDKSIFNADINLKSGNLERTDLITGDVLINYDKTSNLIFVKIVNVLVDIDISNVINLIPKDAVLIHLDLSEYFSEPFEIEGPQPKTISYKIDISKDSKKNININIKDSKLYLIENGIKIFSIYECVGD